jgi:hypothetical protein
MILPLITQEIEGSEGEYDDGMNNEEDELISEGEQEQEVVSDRVGISISSRLIDMIPCVQGSKWDQIVTNEAVAGSADRSATTEETEAQSGRR